MLIRKVAQSYGHKESADLPYSDTGLRQPLIHYGQVYADGHSSMCIKYSSNVFFEVAIRVRD